MRPTLALLSVTLGPVALFAGAPFAHAGDAAARAMDALIQQQAIIQQQQQQQQQELARQRQSAQPGLIVGPDGKPVTGAAPKAGPACPPDSRSPHC